MFFTNYYYNIQLSKSLFFMIITGISFLGIMVTQKRSPIAVLHSCVKSPAQLSVLLFGLSVSISAILSAYGHSAFTGENGRYIGAYMLMSMCICFLLFSQHYVELKPFYAVIPAAGVIVALLGILQFIQIDVLGFTKHIPEQLTGTYLSTIGNINVFSNYISIIAAFCVGVYCLTSKKSLLLCFFISDVALFPANSDGGLLAVLAVIVLCPLFSPAREKAFLYLSEQLLVFSAACIVGKIISQFAITPYVGLPARFTSPGFFIPALFGTALMYLYFRYRTLSPANYAFCRKVYICFIILSASAAILLFAAVILNILSIPALQLSDQWGSGRGYIWKKALDLWYTAPLLQKLFGYGPDTLKLLLLETSYHEMLSATGKIFDSAHNSVLHYLITTGACGALSWSACLLSVLITSIKSKKATVFPWLMAFLAYLIQTMIMPDQPITTPLAFMIAGICIGITSSHCHPIEKSKVFRQGAHK
ncbi:MAG: O-antigen ligase family protein [Lachnospiraceae bacterium]|nr:O-antigen ligase family protein [Lachnospiraceae bacterium]